MAVGTASGNASMIELSASEANNTLMTGFTSFGGWYMVIRLSYSCRAVMTAGTARNDASVIKLGALEACCASMASFTTSSRFYMV